MIVNRCVCCGSPIPEGRQVCRKCEMNCGNCQWRSDDFTSVCVNAQSPRRADFVDAGGWCPAWEKAGGK